jgi:hypothetical protein
MIQSNFIKVFNVMVYHTFYDNGKCKSLHFTPSSQTEKALRKFGFLINTSSNGFDLFYNATTSIESVLNYITSTTSLEYFEFTIESDTPNFIYFTALPINWLGQITYTSQDPKNQNKDTKIQLNQTFETKESTLQFGQLKIYFVDIIKQNSSQPIQFEINFEARATQWQYYIINKNSIPMDNPLITDKGSMQFDGPKKTTLQTGEEALLFTSGTTYIAQSEKIKNKFDLVNKNKPNESTKINSNAKIILKGLPVPDVSRIVIIENNQVASPMYIYL